MSIQYRYPAHPFSEYFLYVQLYQGGESRVRLTATIKIWFAHCINEGKESVTGYNLLTGTQCTASNDNADRTPDPFCSLCQLLTERWLAGRWSSQVSWLLIFGDCTFHWNRCPSWPFWRQILTGILGGLGFPYQWYKKYVSVGRIRRNSRNSKEIQKNKIKH